MSIDRPVTIRRIRTGSVFRLMAAGVFCSVLPLCLFFGVLALFGLNTIKWNNQPIYGIKGLLLSPVIGGMIAAAFTILGGVGVSFGLWVYSRFRPLSLVLVEDSDSAAT